MAGNIRILYDGDKNRGENMRLRDYLWAHDMTSAQFAKKIRYSKEHVRNVMNGMHSPSKRFIEDIVNYTNGMVKEDEVVCEKGWMLKKNEEDLVMLQTTDWERDTKKEKFEQLSFPEIQNK